MTRRSGGKHDALCSGTVGKRDAPRRAAVAETVHGRSMWSFRLSQRRDGRF